MGKKVESLPDDFYSTTYYTDVNCWKFIDQNKRDGKPFFAFLSYTAPHDPLHAPKTYIDKYKGKYDGGWDVLSEAEITKPEGTRNCSSGRETVSTPGIGTKPGMRCPQRKERQHPGDMEVYAAMIDYMDEQIARVFDYLKEIGEYDNTMIIFLSDNGANGHLPTAYPGQTEEYLDSFDNSLENRGLVNSFIEPGPGWAQASMAPSRLFKGFYGR